MTDKYDNFYDAKREREAKPKPTDWVILPEPRGTACRLVYLGPARGTTRKEETA